MESLFKVKVRRIGTSFGVLIPKKLLKENKIKLGEEIEIALLKRQKLEAIQKLIGITKGAAPFRREHADRF